MHFQTIVSASSWVWNLPLLHHLCDFCLFIQVNLNIWSTKEFVSQLHTSNVMASVGVQANILDIDDHYIT